jgi:hypothetical protein
MGRAVPFGRSYAGRRYPWATWLKFRTVCFCQSPFRLSSRAINSATRGAATMLARAPSSRARVLRASTSSDRPRHLCAHRPDDLGADVRQFRVNFFCQGRLFPRDFLNLGASAPYTRKLGSGMACLVQPMDLQMLGFAGAFLQPGHGLRLLDGDTFEQRREVV